MKGQKITDDQQTRGKMKMTKIIKMTTKASKDSDIQHDTILSITDWPENLDPIIDYHAAKHIAIKYQESLRKVCNTPAFNKSDWVGNVERELESFKPSGRGDPVKKQERALESLKRAFNLDDDVSIEEIQNLFNK